MDVGDKRFGSKVVLLGWGLIFMWGEIGMVGLGEVGENLVVDLLFVWDEVGWVIERDNKVEEVVDGLGGRG